MNKALDKALSILEFVANKPDKPKRLGEVAEGLGLNPATCAHILKSFVELDYVEQISPRQGYILGPKVYYLARGGSYRQDIVKPARLVLADLVQEVRESVVLASWHNGRRYLLDFIEAGQEVRIDPNCLLRDDIYCTATGNVLLANQPEEELRAFLKAQGLPPNTDSEQALYERLSVIRRDRMAEHRQGEVVQVAMPVFERGSVVAAVGIAVPESRYSQPQRERIMAALRSAVAKIGEELDARAGGLR